MQLRDFIELVLLASIWGLHLFLLAPPRLNLAQ